MRIGIDKMALYFRFIIIPDLIECKIYCFVMDSCFQKCLVTACLSHQQLLTVHQRVQYWRDFQQRLFDRRDSHAVVEKLPNWVNRRVEVILWKLRQNGLITRVVVHDRKAVYFFYPPQFLRTHSHTPLPPQPAARPPLPPPTHIHTHAKWPIGGFSPSRNCRKIIFSWSRQDGLWALPVTSTSIGAVLLSMQRRRGEEGGGEGEEGERRGRRRRGRRKWREEGNRLRRQTP